MSEALIPSTLINIYSRSDNLIVSNAVYNAAAALAVVNGTAILPAFTGTAALERAVILLKCPYELELTIVLAAATTTATMYNGVTLIGTSAASTAAQVLGTIPANTTVILSFTSSVAIVASAAMCTLGFKNKMYFQNYFMDSSPTIIPGMITTYNSNTGAPTYTFTNATLVANSSGYVNIDTYYNASAGGLLTFTVNGISWIGLIPSQSFSVGDNITVAIKLPTQTVMNVSGSITVNIANLGISTAVPVVSTPYPILTVAPGVIGYNNPMNRLATNNFLEDFMMVEEQNPKAMKRLAIEENRNQEENILFKSVKN